MLVDDPLMAGPGYGLEGDLAIAQNRGHDDTALHGINRPALGGQVAVALHGHSNRRPCVGDFPDTATIDLGKGRDVPGVVDRIGYRRQRPL